MHQEQINSWCRKYKERLLNRRKLNALSKKLGREMRVSYMNLNNHNHELWMSPNYSEYINKKRIGESRAYKKWLARQK